VTDGDPGLARKLSIKLLSRREHSQAELLEKLARKGHAGPEIREMLEELVAAGWQSDQRFAEAFMRDRRGRGQGPMRIQMGLRERGVGDDLVTAALAEESDWGEQLRRVAERRFGIDAPDDLQEGAKRMRFLYNRGFLRDQIRNFFRDAGWNNP